MFNYRIWLPIVVLILVGCGSGSDTSPPEEKADPDLQIRIMTTSDWTTFRLVSGAILDKTEIMSASSEATRASFNLDRFELTQPLIRAEVGDSVEMVADLFFTKDTLSENLEFEIERGHIGETKVVISSYACGQPFLIETFTWRGPPSLGENVRSFTMPSAKLRESPNNEYTVIAQLNFWYFGAGAGGGFENDSGERTTPLTPLLGETYWANNPDVVYQQIEWAAEYGVDAFYRAMTTPRGVGCCGSMEDTLDDIFLESPNINKVRWAIFYDFVLRLDQTPGLQQYVGSLDFDEPEVYDTLVSDFKHFAKKYFGHPQYLNIDERPVIYIWATNAFVGNIEGALREAREEVAKLGYDVYIVGEEVKADGFDPYHASLFDGNTAFTFLMGGLDFTTWKDTGDAIDEVDQAFEYWRANIKDLKVIDREEFVNFQPAWAPQYDERLFVGDQGIYIPATSKNQVMAMAEMVRKHAEPAGSQGQKLIWLNTWNNWAETTTVEPTANLGPKYPGGNYQFDMLEVVRDVFGPETPSCETP